MTTAPNSNSRSQSQEFPWFQLLALAAISFITIVTEVGPAGLLLPIASGMGISDAQAGQLVTSYALGSVCGIIPLVTVTRYWGRRRILLTTMSVLAVGNALLAANLGYIPSLIIRFICGAAAGLSWSTLSSYALALVSTQYKTRAVSIAGAGAPVALSIGVPLSTSLSSHIGWQPVFLVASLFSLITILWILFALPEITPTRKKGAHSWSALLRTRAIVFFLGSIALWVLAYGLQYTYLAPDLKDKNMESLLSPALMLFGISSLLSIWVVGTYADRFSRAVTTLVWSSFSLGTVLFILSNSQEGAVATTLILASVGLWGFGFGGAPPLIQAPMSSHAGENINFAQAAFSTVFNCAIAGGGALGGLILNHYPLIGLHLVALLALLLAAFTINKALGQPLPQTQD